MDPGATPNFSQTCVLVADLPGPAIELHDPVPDDTLGQVLVGRADDDLAHLGVLRRHVCGRGQRVVGLELDHRPEPDAERGERRLEDLEL